MKKIQKKVVSESYYDVFVANDGQEFSCEEECRKYDESAEGVLNAKLKKIMVRDGAEEDLFFYGSCDSTIEVFRPANEDDGAVILQMFLLKNVYMTDKNHAIQLKENQELIDRAVRENDYIIVNRGYAYDGFWFIGTRNSMKERLDEFCEKKQENND